MKNVLAFDDNFYRTIIDGMPSAVFLMDDETRILDCNKEAAKISKKGFESGKLRLCGDVMRCTHALNETEGCGNTKYCKDCGIRTSINLAVKDQKKVMRQKTLMYIDGDKGPIASHFLITTSVLKHGEVDMMLVSLEDISEIIHLGGVIPTCNSCKKVRNAEGIWYSMDDYIQNNSDIQFSQTICSDCAQKKYPDLKIYKDDNGLKTTEH